MIVSIGEVYYEAGVAEGSLRGKAFGFALESARQGKSVLFAGAVSADEKGRKILECLIDNCILFEPSLCSCSKPTATADAGGVFENDIHESCVFSLTGRGLESVFSMNTDVDEVYVGGLVLTDPDVRKTVVSVLKKSKYRRVCFDIPQCPGSGKIREELERSSLNNVSFGCSIKP